VADPALVQAFAATLGIPEDTVRVVDAFENQPPGTEDASRLVIERTPAEGDFSLQLSLYLRDAKLEQRLQSPTATLMRIKQLCRTLQRACLLSDDSLSPVSWLRVLPSGEIEEVTLDADRLEDDEYVVESARPATTHAVNAP